MNNERRIYSLGDIVKNLCSTTESEFKDCINYIQSSNTDDKILTEEETETLSALEKLYEDLEAVPTFEVFKSHYPSFNIVSDVELADVLASTKLFIKQRKNSIASKSLIHEANQILTEGLNPRITERIYTILKSNPNSIKYENIKDKIVDIYEQRVDNSGIKTYIEVIDKEIGGLKAGQVSVLAGFTGMGKSICSVSIMHSAIEQGFNVCYLSLELSAEHLMYNLISRHSLEPKFSKKIEHKDLKSKTLSDEAWDYVEKTILPDLDTLPGKFYILDEQDIDAYNYFAFDNKLQEIETLCIQETGKGLDLIIVDHIQMLAYSKHDSRIDTNTIVNGWCNYFRSNCLDFLKTKRQVHVTLVAQINRQGYLKAIKHKGMYDLTALKEANELETCAAVILGIFSDPSLIVSNQAKVGIMKHRDGSRSSEAYIVPADFPYQLIGSIGSTLNSLIDKSTKADASNFDIFSSAFDEPGSMNFDGIDFDGSGPIDLTSGMEE